MHEVELSAGTVAVQDTGGDGPVVVLIGGLFMDDSLWGDVVSELRADHRCVVPVLPLGSHLRAMRPDADLSMPGHARIVAELLERLELRDVVLVGCDLGLAQVVAAEHPERIERLVLCSQEAFDNFPPGLPGRVAALATRVPGGVWLALQSLRVPVLQRTPTTLGWMAKRPIPRAMVERWTRPGRSDPAVRRDVRRYVATTDRRVLVEAAETLRRFDRPSLVVWASEDRVMPPEHGRRLAELLPHGRLVEIADSYTLLPLDQPQLLARAIRSFVREADEVPA